MDSRITDPAPNKNFRGEVNATSRILLMTRSEAMFWIARELVQIQSAFQKWYDEENKEQEGDSTELRK